MRSRPRLLLIDENRQDRALAGVVLGQDPRIADLCEVGDGPAFVTALDGGPWDVVITADSTAWASGPFLVQTIREYQPDAAIVVFSEVDDRESAVAIMKAGADDFVVKSPAGYLHLVDAIGELRIVPHQPKPQLDRPAEPGEASAPAQRELAPDSDAVASSLGSLSTDPEVLAALEADNSHFSQRTVEVAFEVMKSVLADLDEAPERPAVETGEAGEAEAGETGAGEADRQAPDEIEILKRQRETLLERVDDLEHSNADLSEFAFIASHELQEPLRMVSKFSALLRGDLSGQVSGPAEESLRFLLDGADRMQSLIDDLLAFARINSAEPQAARCDIAELVEQACVNLQARIEESGAEIETDDLPWVTGDPGQLQMVFANLISNALKFRGDDPPRVRIGFQRVDDQYQIAVRDNGIGIDAADQDRIFTIFARLHPERGGTGIGLALARRVIERHGGHIWVESEPGMGTTFFLSLPASETQKVEEPKVVHIHSGKRRRAE